MLYHILRMPSRPQYAEIEDEPDGFDRYFIVNQGTSCKDQIVGSMTLSLTRRHKGTKLDDFICNLPDWIIARERVKEILAEECNNVEIYRVEIVDQKGKPVKARYYFVHPVGTVDCVDRKKSEFDPMPGNPEKKVPHFRKASPQREADPEGREALPDQGAAPNHHHPLGSRTAVDESWDRRLYFVGVGCSHNALSRAIGSICLRISKLSVTTLRSSLRRCASISRAPAALKWRWPRLMPSARYTVA
jgi:hypothetical protein